MPPHPSLEDGLWAGPSCPALRNAHLGRLTLTVPTGTISRDLPQNLFFHFMSGVGLGDREQQQRLRPEGVPGPSPSALHSQLQPSPCQKMKFSDSAWHAEMGGWWETLRSKEVLWRLLLTLGPQHPSLSPPVPL